MPLAVFVLSLSIFCLGTSEFMIAGLLPEIAADLSVSIPSAGLLISAFALGMIVGAPAMALATAKVPPKRALVGLLAVFAVAHVASALAPGYGVLMVTRVVSAVVAGAFWGVGGAMAIAVAGEERQARALATLMSGLTIANVAGVPLGAVIGQAAGWRTTFWVVAAVSVLALVALVVLVPNRRPEGADVRAEFDTVRGAPIWWAYGAIALFQGAAFCAFSYLAVLVTDAAGLPESVVPVVLALNGVGAFVGVTLGGRIADARPWQNAFVSVTAMVSLMVVLALLSGSAAAVLVLVPLLAVATFSAAPALSSRAFAAAGRPSTLASAGTVSAFNVGNMAGPWLGGLAIGAGLGVTSPLWVGGALAIAAIGVVVGSRRSVRSHCAVAVAA